MCSFGCHVLNFKSLLNQNNIIVRRIKHLSLQSRLFYMFRYFFTSSRRRKLSKFFPTQTKDSEWKWKNCYSKNFHDVNDSRCLIYSPIVLRGKIISNFELQWKSSSTLFENPQFSSLDVSSVRRSFRVVNDCWCRLWIFRIFFTHAREHISTLDFSRSLDWNLRENWSRGKKFSMLNRWFSLV